MNPLHPCQSARAAFTVTWHVGALQPQAENLRTKAQLQNLAIQLQHVSEQCANCKHFSHFRKTLPPATRSLSPPRRSNQTATFVGPMIFVRVLGRKPLLSGHETEAMRATGLSESVVFQKFKEGKTTNGCKILYSKCFYLCKSCAQMTRGLT